MSHDDDLYHDLPEGTTSEYIAEIENEVKTYKIKYDDSQKLIKELEKEKHRHLKQINELKKKVENLERNISSLYTTAVAEVGRKQKMLNDLQSEFDNLAFRRRRSRKDLDNRYHDDDVNPAYERNTHGSNDRQRNYCKKNDHRGHELTEEKYSNFDRSDRRKGRHYTNGSRKKPDVFGSRNSQEVQNNFSIENRIDHRRSGSNEEKHNSCGRNDHRRNGSYDEKSRTKIERSFEDRHLIKSSDQTAEISSSGLRNYSKLQNGFNNSDYPSNKCPREKPTDNQIEKKRNSFDTSDHRRNESNDFKSQIKHTKSKEEHSIKPCDQNTSIKNKIEQSIKPNNRAEIPPLNLNHHPNGQNILSNSDDVPNKTAHKKPAASVLEEIFGQKNDLIPCEAALFSMKKQSWKLITPLKETPDNLKEKYSQIESNKTTVKIPMINEQRMLSPFKNVGRVEIVSRCVDEVESPQSTNSEVAAACSVTISEDIEHGVFSRRSRKRPRINNVIIANVKKVATSS